MLAWTMMEVSQYTDGELEETTMIYLRLMKTEETYGSRLSVLPYILFEENLLPQLNMNKMVDPPCVIRRGVTTVYTRQVCLDALLPDVVRSCLVNA